MSASSPPPPQPDPDSLTSLDDLIRQQQQNGYLAPAPTTYDTPHQRGRRRTTSSGANTVVLRSSNDELNGNAFPSSTQHGYGIDDGGGSGDSSMTIRAVDASSPPPPQPQQSNSQLHTHSSPQRDESRWNGFHLWRAESYQRRVSQHERQRQTAEEERRLRQQRRQCWSTLSRARRRLTEWWDPASAHEHDEDVEDEPQNQFESRLRMILLTIVMAGLQTAWCLEFAYGTPYLLSLKLSKSSTSLVWLAAPLSGLIVQPLIGVVSDLDVSDYRRRRYIAGSTIALATCTLVLAFSLPLASALADVLHAGLADWDPARTRARDDINCFLAVSAFVGLDVSNNGLQASARALVLDVTPSWMHARANAWSARMLHVGSVLGYAAGWYDLSTLTWLSWLGGGQMRKYAIVSTVSVLVCSAITCASIDEPTAAVAAAPFEHVGINSTAVTVMGGTSAGDDTPDHIPIVMAHPVSSSMSFFDNLQTAVQHIWQSIRRLPRPIRRICLVQMFAFVGWFPFLIYATEWVIEVWREEQKKVQDDNDKATELGSFALLLFALVGFAAGALLPYLALANWRAKQQGGVRLEDDDNDSDDQPAATTITTPPRWRLSLRTFWTISLVMYFVQASILTFFARTTATATALVASIGVPWAVALWVPYALVMESVREAEDGMSPYEFEADWFAPARVRDRRESRSYGGDGDGGVAARQRAARALYDCEPLGNGNGNGSVSGGGGGTRRIVSRGCEVVAVHEEEDGHQHDGEASTTAAALKYSGGSHVGSGQSLGATILGIHNMALVFPQLFVALVAALLFRDGRISAVITTSSTSDGGALGVVWMLRFGGLAALAGAVLTRFVPLARTERLLRESKATTTTTHHAESGDVAEYEDEDEDEEDGHESPHHFHYHGGRATPTNSAVAA